MKIGIDIRAACGHKTGKGWYTFNVVKEILELEKKFNRPSPDVRRGEAKQLMPRPSEASVGATFGKNEYVLYTDKVTADLAVFHNATIKVIHVHPFFWHFAVIKDFLRRGGELFFAPTSFIIPAFLPRKIKSIITIHDLVAFLHPRLHETKAVISEHLFLRMVLRKTSAVLVPSENTKKDLIRIFHYPEKKIIVTLLAPAASLTPHPLPFISKKYNLPNRPSPDVRRGEAKQLMPRRNVGATLEFILTVAGLEPRKNVNMLVDAVLALNKALVIVGGKGWKSNVLQKKISEHKKHIIHIENCPPEDLAAFYKAAKFFVFPSFYEGFGLPPLEAMQAGCPVICSNAGSLKEICGDAAILIDPTHPQELKNAIEKLWNDEKLQDSLREKGFDRAKKFSWEETATKTLEIFKANSCLL